MKAHVISLPNSPRRYVASQRATAANLVINFIDAIDALTNPIVENVYSTSAKTFQIRYGRRQTLGELACLLSHQSLYQSLAKENPGYHLILEDDFIPLVDAKNLSEILSFAIHQGADLVLLGYAKVDDELERAINVSNPLMNTQAIPYFDHVIGQRCHETTCGAVSYFVSPKFLYKMSRNVDYGRLADDWTYHDQLGLKIMHVKPLCFLEDYLNMSSSLEPSRRNDSQKRWIRLPRFLRPLWRVVLGLIRRTQFHVNKLHDL